jgi:PAS domain S-box-containing protein
MVGSLSRFPTRAIVLAKDDRGHTSRARQLGLPLADRPRGAVPKYQNGTKHYVWALAYPSGLAMNAPFRFIARSRLRSLILTLVLVVSSLLTKAAEIGPEQRAAPFWEATLQRPPCLSSISFASVSIPLISRLCLATGAVLFGIALIYARRSAASLNKSAMALRESEARLKMALEAGGMAVWEWDLTTGKIAWTENIQAIQGTSFQHGPTTTQELLRDIVPEDRQMTWDAIREAARQGRDFQVEYRMASHAGQVVWIEARGGPVLDAGGHASRLIGLCTDITQRKRSEETLLEETKTLETLNRIGPSLLSELNLEKLVQAITDAATQLTGANFGAFLYKASETEARFHLYALSGVPRDAFANSPSREKTTLSDATFSEALIRIGDVLEDPRLQETLPFNRMPLGNHTVRSYLAVAVVSRSGDVVGRLLFGNSKPNAFTERSERIALAIAAQAGIAIDNARLFKAAQTELAERTRAETALRESREHLQRIADALPVLIGYVDAEERFLFNNRTCEDWFLMSRREMSGRPIRDILGPDAYGLVQPHVAEALQGREATFEARIPFRSGTRYVHATHVPHWTEFGNVAGFFLLVADITARKQAEEEAQFLSDTAKVLSESLEFEETLASVARFAVPRMADWCMIDMLTPSGELQRLEVAHADPLKKNLALELKQWGSVERDASEGSADVIRTGKSQAYYQLQEEQLRHVAHDERHLTVMRKLELKSALVVAIKARERIFGAITLAYAESGRHYAEQDLRIAEELALRAGLAVDNALLFRQAEEEIEERTHAQHALHESEERFRLMVERAQDYAIFIMDKEGRISNWNPGAEHILGYTEAEVMGQPGGIIFTPEDREKGMVEREISVALDRGQAVDERWHMRKDGSRFWSSGFMIALRDQAGKLRGFAKIMRDMTDSKKSEEAICRLNQDLERRVEKRTADLRDSNEQMEAFIYTVAHDLRAPLRAMQGFSQALMEDYAPQLNNEAQEYVHRVISSAQRMDHLIQDLLTYSRLSRTQISFEKVSLEQVTESVLSTFLSEVATKRAHITVEHPLPNVTGHIGTLEHIVTNLIGNALKFVAPGVSPRVRIWAENQNDVIRLWIEDNGIGIPSQYHDRIFRVFERLHGAETYPGTGIGLAIVRKGIERMKGRVGVKSDAACGSQFWIELQPAAA